MHAMDICTTIFGESIIFTVNPLWHGRSYKLHLEKQQSLLKILCGMADGTK